MNNKRELSYREICRIMGRKVRIIMPQQAADADKAWHPDQPTEQQLELFATDAWKGAE